MENQDVNVENSQINNSAVSGFDLPVPSEPAPEAPAPNENSSLVIEENISNVNNTPNPTYTTSNSVYNTQTIPVSSVNNRMTNNIPTNNNRGKTFQQKNNPILKGDDLLRAFIGPNYEKILKRPFNLSAFLFTFLYYFYRKMILFGIIIMLIEGAILYFFSSTPYAVLGVNLLCSLLTNRIYVSFAVRKVNKTLSNHPTLPAQEVKGMCYVLGGRSIKNVIISIIWELLLITPLLIVLVFVTSTISLGDISTKYNIKIPNINIDDIKLPDVKTNDTFNGQIVVDKSFKINQLFWFTIPSEFKPTENNNDYQLDYSYKSSHKDLSTCSFSLRGISGYSNAETLINSMRNYYMNEVTSEIREKTIDKLKWYYFTTQNNDAITYYYACSKNTKVYLYIYRDEVNSSESCHNYATTTLSDIKYR